MHFKPSSASPNEGSEAVKSGTGGPSLRALQVASNYIICTLLVKANWASSGALRSSPSDNPHNYVNRQSQCCADCQENRTSLEIARYIRVIRRGGCANVAPGSQETINGKQRKRGRHDSRNDQRSPAGQSHTTIPRLEILRRLVWIRLHQRPILHAYEWASRVPRSRPLPQSPDSRSLC